MPILSPFPYFGGKRRIAARVWQAFGDVPNYVEPFGGSLAVLLARPAWEGRTETVNEWNPYIANFWRATATDPEAVAFYADWPVNEADLHARHAWLRAQLAAGFRDRMLTDPDYADAKIAGWWVWGQCAWIGTGWCDGDSEAIVAKVPHLSDNGLGVHRSGVTQVRHLGNAGMGVHRSSLQIPHLSDAGLGDNAQTRRVSQQLPHIADGGRGVHRARHPGLIAYFAQLHERLRRVRVTCGDWTRILGESVTVKHGTTAVFLDPPYGEGDMTYGHGSGNGTAIAPAVLEWCRANWSNPALRIVLCGYEGALDVPAEWCSVAWKQRAGYQSQDKGNAERERLWLSPGCVGVDLGPLFAAQGAA